MAGAGFEDMPQTSEETQILKGGNAESNANQSVDERLLKIMEAWPHLPKAIRAEIYLLMVSSVPILDMRSTLLKKPHENFRFSWKSTKRGQRIRTG